MVDLNNFLFKFCYLLVSLQLIFSHILTDRDLLQRMDMVTIEIWSWKKKKKKNGRREKLCRFWGWVMVRIIVLYGHGPGNPSRVLRAYYIRL